VPPVPARVGVLPEVRGRLHGAGGVGLAKGPEEQGAQGVAVVGGLVLGAPEVDGGVGPQDLHHGPGLAQSLPCEGLVGGVAPLEGKVLPDQNPFPVAGPVEGGVGHVGVDPDRVQLGLLEEGHVPLGRLLAVGRKPLGGDDVGAPQEEAAPVQKEPAFPVHLHGAEAQGDGEGSPGQLGLEAEEVGEAPLPHLPKGHLRQVPDHLPPGPPRLPLEGGLLLPGLPREVFRKEAEPSLLAKGPGSVQQEPDQKPPARGGLVGPVGQGQEGHLLPGQDLHPAPEPSGAPLLPPFRVAPGAAVVLAENPLDLPLKAGPLA
jgi:hypothetical protein